MPLIDCKIINISCRLLSSCSFPTVLERSISSSHCALIRTHQDQTLMKQRASRVIMSLSVQFGALRTRELRELLEDEDKINHIIRRSEKVRDHRMQILCICYGELCVDYLWSLPGSEAAEGCRQDAAFKPKTGKSLSVSKTHIQRR